MKVTLGKVVLNLPPAVRCMHAIHLGTYTVCPCSSNNTAAVHPRHVPLYRWMLAQRWVGLTGWHVSRVLLLVPHAAPCPLRHVPLYRWMLAQCTLVGFVVLLSYKVCAVV